MESWVSLGRKEARTNIRISAKPRFEQGTLWLEGRDHIVIYIIIIALLPTWWEANWLAITKSGKFAPESPGVHSFSRRYEPVSSALNPSIWPLSHAASGSSFSSFNSRPIILNFQFGSEPISTYHLILVKELKGDQWRTLINFFDATIDFNVVKYQSLIPGRANRIFDDFSHLTLISKGHTTVWIWKNVNKRDTISLFFYNSPNVAATTCDIWINRL